MAHVGVSINSEQQYRLGEPPHPVIVIIRDNRDFMRVLLYSHYTTTTGWVVLLKYGDQYTYNLHP